MSCQCTIHLSRGSKNTRQKENKGAIGTVLFEIRGFSKSHQVMFETTEFAFLGLQCWLSKILHKLLRNGGRGRDKGRQNRATLLFYGGKIVTTSS
jgi:hypothetical protein